MGIEINDISKKSNGGTELMLRRLDKTLQGEKELAKKFHIICSRIRAPLARDKYRILWQHDLPDDPESHHLARGGWSRFDRIVFVSHTQRQAYIQKYGIHWSKTLVLPNAIEPIDPVAIAKKFETFGQGEKIRVVYHTTPHRGLALAYHAVKSLAEKHPYLHLDVYSSFGVYGWAERDKQFAELFEAIQNHPNMTYHGAKSNEEVRSALVGADIFLYPSIWPETSCLSLMEAMSAGLICVHSDYGALPETAAGLTSMYSFHEQPEAHAAIVTGALDSIVTALRTTPAPLLSSARMMKGYADYFYNWDHRAMQWLAFMKSMTSTPITAPEDNELFIYEA